jgi:hypothetical protein
VLPSVMSMVRKRFKYKKEIEKKEESLVEIRKTE